MLILLTAPPRYIQASATKRENQPKWLVFNWVDQTAKSSNFFEDLVKLDRFAQSVEDEVNSGLARNGQDNG